MYLLQLSYLVVIVSLLPCPSWGLNFTSHFYRGAEFVGLDAIQDCGHLLEMTQTSSFANGVGWGYSKDKMRKGF